MKNNSLTLELGSTRFIHIKSSKKGPILNITGGSLEANEVMAVACITEILRCLDNGVDIYSSFNPTKKELYRRRIVKCQWLKSGKLRLLDVIPVERFQHAYTISDCMDRKRNFTCERWLYEDCPKLRSDHDEA